MENLIDNLLKDIDNMVSSKIEDPKNVVNTHIAIAHEVVSMVTKEKLNKVQLFAIAECIINAKIISGTGIKINFDSKITYAKDLELIKKYLNEAIDDIINDINSLPVESNSDEKLNKILKDNNLTKEELIALCNR